MKLFAVIIASRYGPVPYPGPIVMLIIIGFFIFACFSGIVNRKKLDEINKNAKSKDELPKVGGKPWKCPKCGEMSEPQFDSCWKCGTVRKVDPTV
jgi:hypothetical protein